MSTDGWQIDLLDLDGYLERLGVPAREPSPVALAELHEAHVRTFTFDNIDVLLGQHPGVSLEAVQRSSSVAVAAATASSTARSSRPPSSAWATTYGGTSAGSATRTQAPSRGAHTWWSPWSSTAGGCSATPASG
jgi:hypothetical protein